ncbi:Zinc knuckle CX2CX4HX4C [Sesbania bispinosa]|nr:Zinc knuckle CX2CX4HX4C [Sesbania bispinosa]
MEQNLIIFDEEDIKEGLQECQNSIIGKLVMEKAVHANSLMNALNSIWNSPKGFKVVDLGDKCFQFFFDSGKDADRVIRGNPWIFRNSWLLLRKWDREVKPEDMSFTKAQIWLQIWGLPVHCRTKQMGRRLGVCMGTVMEADVFEIQGSRKDGIFWADFKFERVPQFCYKCGIIRHDEDGCNSTTQENTDEMSRGPWMRATHVGRPVKAENPQNHHHKPPTNPNQEEKRRKQTQDLLEKLSGLTVQSTLQDAPKNVDSTLPNPPSSSLSTNEKPSDAATLKLQETNRSTARNDPPMLQDISNVTQGPRTESKKWKRLTVGRKDTKEKENVPMAVGGMKRGPDTFPDETMADTEDPRSLKKLHLSIPSAGLEEIMKLRHIGGMNNVWAVSCTGEGRSRSGGLAIFWTDNIMVDILTTSTHHIDAKVSLNNGESSWRCTGIYGYPEVQNKKFMWEVLKRIHRDVGEVPWLCFGDMNQVMSNDEKRGGNLIPESMLHGFGECVQLCGLIDLGYVGPKFTWDNRQKEKLNIKARLNWFLACSRWQDMFPSSVVYHLGHYPSDHCPILLDTNNRLGGRRGKPNVLRFEKIWVDDIECEQVLLEGWSKGGGELHSKMTLCLQVLESWGSRKFGDIPKRIRKSQKKLEHLMTASHEPGKVEAIREEERNLEALLSQEEKCEESDIARVMTDFFLNLFSTSFPRHDPENCGTKTKLLGDTTRICDLVEFSSHVWNSTLIRNHFIPEVADQILCIPLSLTNQDDCFCWGACKDDIYTVKSGYHVALQEMNFQHRGTSMPTSPDFQWKKLWSLPCQPRQLYFIWRLMHHSLPVRANLSRRNIQCDPICPCCEVDRETETHLFRDCSWSKQIWSQSPIDSQWQFPHIESIGEWINNIILVCAEEVVCLFIAICYEIRQARNRKVFEQKEPCTGQILSRALTSRVDQEDLNQQRDILHQQRPSHTSTWTHPPSGWFKTNVDAAHAGGELWGIGVVIRDESGEVVAATTRQISTYPDLGLDEALGVRIAVHFAQEMCLDQVIIEYDCKNVTDLFYSDVSHHSYTGMIVKDCLSFSSCFRGFKVQHARRTANVCAHTLAKFACSFPDCNWVEEAPPCILSALALDISPRPN